MADGYTRFLVEHLMSEVVAGAQSCDRFIPNSFIEQMLDYTIKMKPYSTSMKIDYNERRPLEVEAIFGNPVRVAQETGTYLPQIACVYQQIKFLDAKNCRNTTVSDSSLA